MATLNDIEKRLQEIEGELAAQTEVIEDHISDCKDTQTALDDKIDMLTQKDEEYYYDLHDDIHDAALGVDNNTSRIEALERKNYQGQINTLNDNLDSDVNDLNTQLTEMDIEHHEELHRIANNLNDYSSRLDNITERQTEIEEDLPEHIVISSSEYSQITPDNDKIYFVYEQ
jgi:RNA processing factor Prp31